MILTSVLEAALEEAVSTGADYAEIFAEDTTSGLTDLVDDRIRNALNRHSVGVGVRVFKGLRYAYASASGLSAESVLSAAKKAAAALADGTAQLQLSHLSGGSCENHHPVSRPGSGVALEEKVALARRAYKAARNYSSEISQSTVSLLDVDRNILIAFNKIFSSISLSLP